jgi:hypothetical protein
MPPSGQEYLMMGTKMTTEEFVGKVMEGLILASKKVVEEARQNNQPIVISKDGKVVTVYP